MKKLSAVFLCVILLLPLVSCGKTVDNPYNLSLSSGVEVDTEVSYFSDAVVEDDGEHVDYICIITLNSTDGDEHTVKLFADNTEDANEGCIVGGMVYGTFENSEEITVPAGGLAYAKIIFTYTLPDTYAEDDTLKLDRSLPTIYVVEDK